MRTGFTHHNAILAAQESMLTLNMYVFVGHGAGVHILVKYISGLRQDGGVVQCFDVDVNNVFSSQQVRACSTMGGDVVVIVVCGGGGGRGHVSIPLRMNL